MIRRIAAGAGLVIAFGLVVALVGASAVVMGPLPSRRGRVAVPHLKARVEARFDRQGVPHIRTVLEIDAWRALGFVHAADRLFQMELRRRAARGRLAEVFGVAAVAMDRRARVSGYATLAQRDWEQLAANERAVLEAYAEGVNAFLAEQTLPIEFRALAFRPEPWTPVDSLAFGRLLQDDLSSAGAVERQAFEDARARGLEAAIASYDASVPGSSLVARETADVLAGLARTGTPPGPPVVPVPAGSNAWALSGTRTASGKPLLAGDPHLAAERPGVWYVAQVTSADGLDVIGLTLAGLPGVVIGHNGRVAWSLTMHQADDSDLFLERVDWADGTYRHGDESLPLERTREVIAVKESSNVVVEVARTVHGPIVLRLDGSPGIALARAFAPWTLPFEPRAFLEADRAQSSTEFLEAWSRFSGPSVNVCWADVSGKVGIKVAGAIPRRRSGDGRFPVPGWTTDYDWDGTIPFALLPAIADPREGLVVTANDDWSLSGKRLPYPGDYAEPDRAARAHELASSLHGATVKDMRSMQGDVYSPYAARVVSALRRLSFADARAARAATILARWDARADARGPSRLFYAFMKELRKDAGQPGVSVSWPMLARRIESDGAHAAEGALARAIVTVERDDGTVPERWSWGRVHRLSYPHPFAGALPATLARWLAYGPVLLPGEWHTLDVAGFPLQGDRFDVTQIPSARLIVDLASPDASRIVLPLGQSGQLFDAHAADQLTAWSSGKDFPLPYSAKAVEAATISRLVLIPAE